MTHDALEIWNCHDLIVIEKIWLDSNGHLLGLDFDLLHVKSGQQYLGLQFLSTIMIAERIKVDCMNLHILFLQIKTDILDEIAGSFSKRWAYWSQDWNWCKLMFCRPTGSLRSRLSVQYSNCCWVRHHTSCFCSIFGPEACKPITCVCRLLPLSIKEAASTTSSRLPYVKAQLLCRHNGTCCLAKSQDRTTNGRPKKKNTSTYWFYYIYSFGRCQRCIPSSLIIAYTTWSSRDGVNIEFRVGHWTMCYCVCLFTSVLRYIPWLISKSPFCFAVAVCSRYVHILNYCAKLVLQIF